MRRTIFSSTPPVLSLTRFSVDETGSSDVLIEIAGRRAGFIGWLQTVLGLGTETTMKVTKANISFKTTSLSGEDHSVVPINRIASTHCGYSKPILFLVAGVTITVIGIKNYFSEGMNQPQMILFGLAILSFILYLINKKTHIQIETTGGILLGIAFKRSLIENVSIDLAQAQTVINILNENILKTSLK